MANETFSLHQRLIKASYPIGQTELCSVLLIDDCRYPWVLLVPMIPNIEEIHDLTIPKQILLIQEITAITKAMKIEFVPFRFNIADIGNRVYQLHIHIVARNKDDDDWPSVVWSKDRLMYKSTEAINMLNVMRRIFQPIKGFVPSTNNQHIL